MKIAFLTEMNFSGKIPELHKNMRTEFAWMYALEADHFYIENWSNVIGYDYVMIIFPKGEVFLNAVGAKIKEGYNSKSSLLSSSIILDLKSKNKFVCSIQEGPTWLCNDLELVDQFNFYNRLVECDILFAHNKYDTSWYKGLFPGKRVEVMPTLMIESLLTNVVPTKNNKVILGGNFSRWYGGFQSFIVAEEFNCEKYVQTSHSSRPGEDNVPGLSVLPRLFWYDWMTNLSTFKYAVHMMPTVAAGTFSLNCAYFGIPCIGNKNVDTQVECFPDLSFYPEDVEGARYMAKKLYEDENFYIKCSEFSKNVYKEKFTLKSFKNKLNDILSNIH